MKLVNMTTFVLEQVKDVENAGVSYTLAVINKYANFLKQELTLGMFVPVDEKGNVLEEPKPLKGCEYWEEQELGCDWIIYRKAKTKVLFEGFEVNNTDDDRKRVTNKKGLSVFRFSKNSGWVISEIAKDYIVENLVKWDLTLTDHAKSLIF